MKSKIASTLVSVLIIVGCAAPKDPPPKNMKRVKTLLYDSTTRAMTPRLELFDTVPAREHRVIALITCEGAFHEEIEMKEAIIYKARQLGAEALVWKESDQAQAGGGSAYGGSFGGRRLYRAEAIVFEPPVPVMVPAAGR